MNGLCGVVGHSCSSRIDPTLLFVPNSYKTEQTLAILEREESTITYLDMCTSLWFIPKVFIDCIALARSPSYVGTWCSQQPPALWVVVLLEGPGRLCLVGVALCNPMHSKCCAHLGHLLLGWTTQISPWYLCIRTVCCREWTMKSGLSIQVTDGLDVHNACCAQGCTAATPNPLLTLLMVSRADSWVGFIWSKATPPSLEAYPMGA